MGKKRKYNIPWGWFTIYFNDGLEDSTKVEVLILRGLFQVHKQIERRDGLTFMRMKKRKVIE